MNESIDVSFPNMGWSKYAFLSLFGGIKGINIIPPTPVNSSMVEIGVKLSPEFVCFPFKVTMGELIHLIEKKKVNTLIFAIDKGPCRMGFYAHVQQKIMRDYGVDFRMITLQQDSLYPETDWLKPFAEFEKLTGRRISKFRIFTNIIRFLFKAKYIEELTQYSCIIRCREINKGDTNRTVNRLLKMMEHEESIVRLFRFGTLMRKEFRKIPIKRNIKPLRVIISGEIHVLLEQYVNFDIMKKMGELGMEVYPTFGVFDWLLHKMHINLRRRKLEEIARPFIPLDIGGEAQWDIGAYIEGQKNGFDGMVIVYPFTCMPETTVRGIIEANNPDPFYMPSLYFSFDESSAFEGMRTRLEAFVDMMNVNRANNPKFKDRYEEPKILSEIYDKAPKSVSFRNIMQKIAQPALHRIYIDRYREIPKDKLYAYYLGRSKPHAPKKSADEHTKPSKFETVIGQS